MLSWDSSSKVPSHMQLLIIKIRQNKCKTKDSSIRDYIVIGTQTEKLQETFHELKAHLLSQSASLSN